MKALFMTAVLILCLMTGCGGGSRYSGYEDEAAEVHDDGTHADPSSVEASDIDDEGNYVCTIDCSGHEAGFEWAQENDVTDSSECSGNSQSFIEGCEAFAEARQEQADSLAQEDVAADAQANAEGY